MSSPPVKRSSSRWTGPISTPTGTPARHHGLYLVTAHGRATPLVWMSVPKARLKGRRNRYEDTVLIRLHEVLPPGVTVTILADRGFWDQQLYALLKNLGFDFIIRFRGVVTVESRAGEVRTAREWVPANGTPRQLKNARVTTDRYAVDSVVCVKSARHAGRVVPRGERGRVVCQYCFSQYKPGARGGSLTELAGADPIARWP